MLCRFLPTLFAGFAVLGCSARTVPAPQPTPAERARADSLRNPYTAGDIQFITGMIHHHGQAITMSGFAPTNGASASVRTLAERITTAQADEIALMQQWLRDRGLPAPDPRPTGIRMMHGGVEHDMLMPGMLTEAQMEELRRARGAEFDKRFLQLMIEHHRGAIVMVTDLLATPGAAVDEFVFRLAADIHADQEAEIGRMQRMLFTAVIDR